MALRESCLSTLLKKFGSDLQHDGTPIVATRSIYECAHDWVSQGNPEPEGIVQYFEKYYAVPNQTTEKSGAIANARSILARRAKADAESIPS